MATIKEMAEESYSQYEDRWMHNAYIDGANDVVKELEKLTTKSDDVDDIVYAYHNIVERIKELKGE